MSVDSLGLLKKIPLAIPTVNLKNFLLIKLTYIWPIIVTHPLLDLTLATINNTKNIYLFFDYLRLIILGSNLYSN